MLNNTVIFADIETDDFKDNLQYLIDNNIHDYQLNFRLGCFIKFNYENDVKIEKFHSFNRKEFLDKLTEREYDNNNHIKVKTIYFHNLKFDSKFFISYLKEKYDAIDIVDTGGKTLLISCMIKETRWNPRKNEYDNNYFKTILLFKDSLGILLKSLKEIGIKIGLPKLEFDFKYENKEKAIEYCYRDCEIPYKAMKEFFNLIMSNFSLMNNKAKRLIGFNEIPISLPSICKKIWINIYPKAFYQVDSLIEKKLRKYYYGGLVDCFNFERSKNIYYLDENSEYPFVLANESFSNGKTFIIRTDKLNTNNKNILGWILKIKENQEICLYPLRIDNKVFFAKGIKEVFMSKKEYDFFKKNNYFIDKKIEILKIKYEIIAIEITNFSKLFFMLYKLRNKYSSEHFFNYCFKILMNGGYGKQGQKPIKNRNRIITNKEFDISEVNNKEIVELDDCLIDKSEMYNKYLTNNLVNAILTTSYARFNLWKQAVFLIQNKAKVYYADTDSLPTDINGFIAMKDMISNNLGSWKVESIFDTLQIIDCKEYYSINKDKFECKFKGIPKKSIKTDNIVNLKSKEMLMNHIKDGTPVNLIGGIDYCIFRKSTPETVFIIVKHKNSWYSKREILSDLSTKPLEISNFVIKEKDINGKTNLKINKEYMENLENNNKEILLNHLLTTV